MLQRVGFFDFILPFVLFFSIFFGILDKSKIFGDRKDINSLIAFVIAFITAAASWAVKLVSSFLPYVGIIAIILLGALLLAGMVTPNLEEALRSKYVKWGAGIFIVIAIGYALVSVLFPGAGVSLSPADIAFLVLASLGIIAFYFIIKGSREGGSSVS